MKTLSAQLQAHIAGEQTSLSTCWKVTRTDAVQLFFTDYDANITVSGDVYEAATGFFPSAISTQDKLNVDNLEVTGILTSQGIDEVDLSVGLYDGATVEVFLVNSQTPADGIIMLSKGVLGEVTVRNGVFTAEVRSLTQSLAQVIGERYSAICRADLGDSRCKVVLADFTVTGTITGVTDRRQFADTDRGQISLVKPAIGAAGTGYTLDDVLTIVGGTGTATTVKVTGETAGVIDSVVVVNHGSYSAAPTFPAAVTGGTGNDDATFSFTELTEIDDYFTAGLITWTSGLNDTFSMELKAFTAATGAFELIQAMALTVQIGDTYSIYAGCNKTLFPHCRDKFNNIVNFRGEPYLPGLDEAVRYAVR